jgi:signal transduction histidine kinase/GGDEF domain-containing protein
MNDPMIKVLLIEDDPGDADLLREILSQEKQPAYEVEWVNRLRLGLDRLLQGDIQVVLLDLSLPDSHGLDTVLKVRNQMSNLPVIVLTGLDDESLAVKAVGEGAQDYVVKGTVDGRMLTRSIRYAIERSQMLAQLEEAHHAEIQERIKLDRMKDEFIGTVSHELRTPLTLIKGSIENLKDGVFGPLTENQAGVLGTIGYTIERLTRIIGDLLDLSRLESGRARIDRRRVNLSFLIRETLQNFAGLAEKRRILLSAEIADSLPPVYADPDLVIQVLNNLLNNALGFARGKILVRARPAPEEASGAERGVQVTVEDDGPGIVPEKMEVIFEKYVQLDQQAGGGGYRGTGLGLAICKEILERHRGRIWAESVPGNGAKFHFALPVYDDEKNLLFSVRMALIGAEGSKTPVSLLALRLKNFGEMEKEGGPREIERLFQEVEGKIWQKVLRKTDSLHYGSKGKFLILLSETDREGAWSASRRIEEATKGCFCAGGKGKIPLQWNFGVAVYPEDGTDLAQLLQRALKP